MKRKLLVILLFLLTLVLFLFVAKPKETKAETANGYRIEQVYTDKFNKKDVDSSWKLNGATLDLKYCGIHCISPVGYGHGPLINAATLADKTKICFTIYPQSGQEATNISFNIGMATASTIQTEPNVDCKVQFWNNQLVFTDWQHNLAVNEEKMSEHVLHEFSGLYSDLLRTDVALYIERKSSNLTQIYAEYYREGELVYSNKNKPFELEDPQHPYGYCGFFWDVVEMDLTNFEWYNNDQLVFEDDLSENTLTYPSTDISLGNFHVNDILNESNVYVSRVNSVLMDNQNESIINSNSLVKIENVSNPYEFSSSIKVNDLAENSFFGFGFGLDDEDAIIDAKNAIGFLKKDNLTAELVILKDGVVDRSNSYQIALSKLINNDYVNYTFKLYADNTIDFTVNGLTFKFSNINFYGQVGIGLVSLGDGTLSSSAEMNEFSLMRNVYYKYDSVDQNNDFKGTYVPNEKEPFLTEPYINDQKYFLGSNVLLEEDWETFDTYVSFTNSSPYSGFGTCKEYTEWMVEFDLEVFSHMQNNYIGVSFGKKSIVDLLSPASISNSAYLLRCNGGGASTSQVTYGANCMFEGDKTVIESPINVFSKTSTKYHLIFIGKNRTVSLYMKAADAPDTELGILRGKIVDVNIDGFVSIVGSGGSSFSVKNYKMVNLSDECTIESPITLRESFDDIKNVSDKIALDPMSDVIDEKLVMSNSTVSTTTEKLYEMIRFTLVEVEDKLQVMFSKTKKIIFDVENNKITIKEGTLSTDFECPEANLKNIKNKRFEIIIQGDTISIGYKGFYDPQDKLSKTLLTYTVTSPIEKDYITLSANGNVKLDDLYLFSLDNSVECLTYDYEDDPNNAPTWIVKPGYDPSKVYDPSKEVEDEPVVVDEGCKSSIAFSLVLPLIGILPVLALRKKEEER